MSHTHASRDVRPSPLPQHRISKAAAAAQSQSKQPDLVLQPQSPPLDDDKMATTAKAKATKHLPTIPSLGANRGAVSCPSLQAQVSSLSLDDASSSSSLPTSHASLTPRRNRSHAIDLMGLDLSCLKCNDDASTGEHYLKVGQAKILHSAHHRKISSSSCVAFAVEAALAEQDEAAMSEKAADDGDDDVDKDEGDAGDAGGTIFGSDDLSLESVPSRADIIKDDDFSFFQEYSCGCLDSGSVNARSGFDDNGDDDDINSHPADVSRISSGNKDGAPLPPLPSSTPRTSRNGISRPKVLAELSPVSVADTITDLDLQVNSAANMAA